MSSVVRVSGIAHACLVAANKGSVETLLSTLLQAPGAPLHRSPHPCSWANSQAALVLEHIPGSGLRRKGVCSHCAHRSFSEAMQLGGRGQQRGPWSPPGRPAWCRDSPPAQIYSNFFLGVLQTRPSPHCKQPDKFNSRVLKSALTDQFGTRTRTQLSLSTHRGLP